MFSVGSSIQSNSYSLIHHHDDGNDGNDHDDGDDGDEDDGECWFQSNSPSEPSLCSAIVCSGTDPTSPLLHKPLNGCRRNGWPGFQGQTHLNLIALPLHLLANLVPDHFTKALISDQFAGRHPTPSICPAVRRRFSEIAAFNWTPFEISLKSWMLPPLVDPFPEPPIPQLQLLENCEAGTSDRYQPKHSLVNISVVGTYILYLLYYCT